MCWWPPNCNDKFQINRLVSGNHNPESNWKKHKLLKIFCQTPTYEKGKEKLEYALLLSDVEVEDDAVKRSRHQRHCSKRDAACVDTDEAHSKSNKKRLRVIYESDEESSTGSDTKLTQMPPFPPIPSLLSRLRETEDNGPEKADGSDVSTGVSTPVSRGDFEPGGATDINRKLNLILHKLHVIENRLNTLDSVQQSQTVQLTKTVQDLYKIFPLGSHEELDNFEKELEGETYFKKMVSEFTTIGGHDVQSLTVNILKKLLSNKVAVEYSLQGKKKKKIFKNLLSYQMIISAVRYHKSCATEVDISGCIATWLSQSGLRMAREINKRLPAEQLMVEPTPQ
ncbi:uncharacterized protein LOC116174854 isoform X3 [Photinus pyralis]|nr:uncharacterized protein LOC116159904 isoform X2 [Photinus pyralis]XP_031348734.1 uncharacterized protein LOC116174854 isoform X3 [Photinus pyralis]